MGEFSSALYSEVVESRAGHVFFAMLDVRLANNTVVLPDIMVILNDRIETIAEWGIDGPPSLLVEIASTYTDHRDRGIKREIYALDDVPEYWLVEPEGHCATVFNNPQNGRYLCETVSNDEVVSSTIPELSVDLTALFASISKFSSPPLGLAVGSQEEFSHDNLVTPPDV